MPASPTRTPGAAPAQRRLAAERSAAAQRRIADAQRRRRLATVICATTGVILVVAVLVVVKLVTNAGAPKSGAAASTASTRVMSAVASVPTSTFDAVGTGTATAGPLKLPAASGSAGAPTLSAGGKPEILFVGAEYCPYCAAERWALAVALSRFGTLHQVGQTTSSPSDVYPSTATLSFHGASYTSTHVTFVAKELQSNQVVNGRYAPLDTLTPAEQSIYDKYDAPPYVSTAGSIPFIDFGGRYVISGASYNPAVLQHKTQAQIAAALHTPTSPIARAVLGTANLIIAAICSTTDNQPTAVCTSTAVHAATKKLNPTP
jgi:hypothetical protein